MKFEKFQHFLCIQSINWFIIWQVVLVMDVNLRANMQFVTFGFFYATPHGSNIFANMYNDFDFEMNIHWSQSIWESLSLVFVQNWILGTFFTSNTVNINTERKISYKFAYVYIHHINAFFPPIIMEKNVKCVTC